MDGVRFEIDAAPPSADPQFRCPSSWWEAPADLLARFPDAEIPLPAYDWYRVVDQFLGVYSEDLVLRQRFRKLYAELRSEPPSLAEATEGLRCHIRVRDGLPVHLVTFLAPSEVAIIDFILALFPGRGYREVDHAAAGWRSIALAGSESPLLTARGAQVLVDALGPWQPAIANCAVNWIMRMQPGILFFHAASLVIGEAGILIAGEKGTGKSTLSLALAAHGHEFFGDEVAAVRTGTFALAPFRRSVSVRKGPQAPQVEERLKSQRGLTETFPDGTVRSRVMASELFPAVGSSRRPVRWVFFLRGFEERPRAERFEPRSGDLRLLAPFACTFWRKSSAAWITKIAKLLSTVNCYYLHLGTPEDTARLVERIVRSE